LQAKQDDVDRHRTEAEALEARTKELAFQLKEAQDRLSVLEEETSVARGAVPNAASGTSQTEGVASATQPQGISPADLSRLLAEAQAKAELKLSELRSEVARSERDRLESEEESARHLQDRAKELERLRAVIREKDAEYAEAVRGRRDRDEQIAEVERSKETLRVQIVVLQEKVDELEADKGKMVDLEVRLERDRPVVLVSVYDGSSGPCISSLLSVKLNGIMRRSCRFRMSGWKRPRPQ
jgi:DNA repair exonuclease SbcCD ATPase subunit